MTYRIRNVVVAVGLALLAMMLTLFYVTNYKRSVQRDASSVQVYVAAKDVQAGTAGTDLVKRKDMKVESVPRSAVVPGAISNPDQLGNLVLSAPLYEGEQVSLRRFDDAAAQGIRAQLKGTMRAVEVPGDPNQLLAGTLQQGDHVDVVANVKTNPANPKSRVALRNLVVLRAPDAAAAAGGGTSVSATLELTDKQSQVLLWVLKNADWSLVLRPSSGATASATAPTSQSDVLAGS